MDNVNKAHNDSDCGSATTATTPGRNNNLPQVPTPTSSSFWKTGTRGLPGRLNREGSGSAVNMSHNARPVGSNAFQNYQQSVSDAWDLGDDEFCIISGLSETKISRRVSQSAAINVIKTHRSNLNNANSTTINNNHTNLNRSPAVPTPTAAATDMKLEGPSSSVAPTATVINNNNNAATGSSAHLEGGPPVSHSRVNNNVSEYNQLGEDGDSAQETKKKPRHLFHSYPGRPQLLKLTSNLSKDVENESKMDKFALLLNEPLLNLMDLKGLSWSGVPKRKRPVTWRLLSGYLPTALERRNAVLERKRIDYLKLVDQYFVEANRDESQEETFRQIHIDVPRMNPHVQLFQQTIVQEMFERILFIWAIRHPASGYVQGINDLVTPFFIIFLQEALETSVELETFNVEALPKEKRDIIEADSFWCLSKFLDCIQDNYIFAQLGIQAKVNQLKELIQRIDVHLHKHLMQHGVDYLQFSFRWMNNLLTRELPLHCTIRLWDTYLAESDGFAQFQLYVCAAFLLHWKSQLMQERDFQGLMLMLQNLPTHHWTDPQISVLVAEAYRLKFTYADAPKHFEGKS